MVHVSVIMRRVVSFLLIGTNLHYSLTKQAVLTQRLVFFTHAEAHRILEPGKTSCPTSPTYGWKSRGFEGEGFAHRE